MKKIGGKIVKDKWLDLKGFFILIIIGPYT